MLTIYFYFTLKFFLVHVIVTNVQINFLDYFCFPLALFLGTIIINVKNCNF